MSVRPIDFNGMVQNTAELSHTKTAEDQKPLVQQNFVTVEIQQEADVSTTTIHEQSNIEEGNSDAEGGDGRGYQGNRGQKKKLHQKEKMGDGTVKLKSEHPHFNMSV